MATQYRANQPGSFQDLLEMSASQGYGGPEVPTPPQASQVVNEGVLSPQERQRLVDMLLAPEDPGPAPTVDKPNALALLFSGLGDATAGFAAGKSGNPGFRTNYTGQYVGNLQQQRQDLQAYGERAARMKSEGNRRRASFLLSDDERRQSTISEAALAETVQKAKAQEAQDAIKQAALVEADRRAWEEKKAAQKHTWDVEEQGARFKHENGLKALENSKGEPAEKEKNLKSYAAGADIANGFVRGVPADPKKMTPGVPGLVDRLRGIPPNEDTGQKAIPPETPEQIMREYKDELTASGIFGQARALSLDFFNERMIRAWRQVQESQDQGQ